MKYDDEKMEEYYQSLPLSVQSYINQFGTGLCSLSELMLAGEHYRNMISGPPDTQLPD
jgi:hypothetical protein